MLTPFETPQKTPWCAFCHADAKGFGWCDASKASAKASIQNKKHWWFCSKKCQDLWAEWRRKSFGKAPASRPEYHTKIVYRQLPAERRRPW